MSYFCSLKTFIDWFEMNDMIVNPEKFQAMIMSCDKKEHKYDLNINNSIFHLKSMFLPFVPFVPFVKFIVISVKKR